MSHFGGKYDNSEVIMLNKMTLKSRCLQRGEIVIRSHRVDYNQE